MPKLNNKPNVNNRKSKSKVKKNTRFNYNKADVKLAVAEVFSGMKVAEASKKYNIPESTIRAKKNKKYSDKPPGPPTVLSDQEENELVQWIFYCCKQGFPVTKHKLVENVKLLCDNDGRKTPFTDNKPGRSWLDGFLKRHSNISERISENLSVTRAKVTEYQIREWFTSVINYYAETFTHEDLSAIHSSRIFNADEIGVSMNPKPSTVLAPKGTKNVYNIVNRNEKENVTVLVTANAAGNLAPTLVLFAGQSVPKDVITVGPPNFSFGYSDNGWMTAKNFYEYICNVFFPWVLSSKIELPIILYIDGHSSHVTLPLSKFCSEHQIILVALYPNATHILQPLDVALFRTFRAAYQRSFQALCEESGTISIRKSQVAIVLKKTFDNLDLKKILENGFRTCGLHPLNVDVIDFSKVFKQIKNSCSEELSTAENAPEVPKESIALPVLESLIDEDKLRLFKAHDSSVWKGQREDSSLYSIWYQLAKPTSAANAASNNESCEFQEQNIFENSKSLQSVSEGTSTIMESDDLEATTNDVDNEIGEIFHSEWNPYDQENNMMVEIVVDSPRDYMTIVDHAPQLLSDISMSVPTPLQNQTTTSKTSEIDIQTAELSTHLLSTETVTADSLQEQILISSVQSNAMVEDSQLILESLVPAGKLTLRSQDHSLTISPGNIEPSSPEQPQLFTKKSPFKNITNIDSDMNNFSEPLQKLLHWPKSDFSKKNKKWKDNSIKIPSVLSSSQWQSIQERKENEKRLKAEEIISKKRIKTEQQETKKKEKEQQRVKREEERLKREEIKVQKDKEKFEKQQRRMQEAETKQKLKEEELLKKLKTAQIKKQIAELQQEEIKLGEKIST